jgi:hypothetical protein
MAYSSKYLENLKEGKEFEEYCYRWLEFEKRTRIESCKDLQTQVQVGENWFGIEFKLDKNFRRTGNLYIEIKERSAVHLRYTEAGIYRNDNTFLYAIGDKQTLYVFDKQRLRAYHEWSESHSSISRHKQIENHMRTSIGWLLPIADVIKRKLTADVWELYHVTAQQVNSRRGFILSPSPRKSSRREKEDSLTLFPDLENPHQLSLDMSDR